VLEHGVAVRSAKLYPRAVFYDMQFRDFVRDLFAGVEKITPRSDCQ
jgi:hypothetical protein